MAEHEQRERRASAVDLALLAQSVKALQEHAETQNHRMDRMEEAILVNAGLNSTNSKTLEAIKENTAGLVSAWNTGGSVVTVAKVGGKLAAYFSIISGGLAMAWHYLKDTAKEIADLLFN